MLRQGYEQARIVDVVHWKPGRGGPFRGRGLSEVGRSFEDELALFERQAREEAGRPSPLPRRRPPESIPVP